MKNGGIDIHPTVIIDKSAEIHDDVTIGPYSVIEGDTVIGKGSEIDSHVLIAEGTRIGNECMIFKGAALGCIPQDLKFKGEYSTLEIGDNTTVREFATLNRGTQALGCTVLGSNCLIMAYTHVAHDCMIGDNTILANSVNMGGHVEISDWVTVGGMVPIHQFVRIGTHAFVGGGYRVPLDVPPYSLAAGDPLVYRTVNSVGLKRRGFSKKVIGDISKTYKIIYRRDVTLEKALEHVKEEVELNPEVQEILNFFEATTRGVIQTN